MKTDKRVETKFNELKRITKDPKEMLNKYLSKRVLRTWIEDFIDEGTGEVTSIERNEVLFEKGTLIDQDIAVQIQFYISAGDIENVEVSNQRRVATLASSLGTSPWTISTQIGQKKYKILLYAKSINMAMEIVEDWIGLNFYSRFEITSIKNFENCIVLNDNLQKIKKEDSAEESEEENLDKKFYQIEVKVVYDDDLESIFLFIVNTVDIDRGMIVINDWIYKTIKKRQEEDGTTDEIEFKTSIESAKPISFNYAIEKEFTQVYLDNTVKPQ